MLRVDGQVFSQEDVQRILAALSSAGELQGPEYHKALSDVALALGLSGRGMPLRVPYRGPDATAWRIARALAEDPVPAGYACGPG